MRNEAGIARDTAHANKFRVQETSLPLNPRSPTHPRRASKTPLYFLFFWAAFETSSDPRLLHDAFVQGCSSAGLLFLPLRPAAFALCAAFLPSPQASVAVAWVVRASASSLPPSEAQTWASSRSSGSTKAAVHGMRAAAICALTVAGRVTRAPLRRLRDEQSCLKLLRVA